MLVYLTQSVIACSTLGFSMYMLYIGKDPGVYLPVITGIIGYFMPQPVIPIKNNIKDNNDTNNIKGNNDTNRIKNNTISDIENNIEQPLTN